MRLSTRHGTARRARAAQAWAHLGRLGLARDSTHALNCRRLGAPGAAACAHTHTHTHTTCQPVAQAARGGSEPAHPHTHCAHAAGQQILAATHLAVRGLARCASCSRRLHMYPAHRTAIRRATPCAQQACAPAIGLGLPAFKAGSARCRAAVRCTWHDHGARCRPDPGMLCVRRTVYTVWYIALALVPATMIASRAFRTPFTSTRGAVTSRRVPVFRAMATNSTEGQKMDKRCASALAPWPAPRAAPAKPGVWLRALRVCGSSCAQLPTAHARAPADATQHPQRRLEEGAERKRGAGTRSRSARGAGGAAPSAARRFMRP